MSAKSANGARSFALSRRAARAFAARSHAAHYTPTAGAVMMAFDAASPRLMSLNANAAEDKRCQTYAMLLCSRTFVAEI